MKTNSKLLHERTLKNLVVVVTQNRTKASTTGNDLLEGFLSVCVTESIIDWLPRGNHVYRIDRRCAPEGTPTGVSYCYHHYH